jgi:hypothetical protein
MVRGYYSLRIAKAIQPGDVNSFSPVKGFEM